MKKKLLKFEKIQNNCDDMYECDCFDCKIGYHCNNEYNNTKECIEKRCPRMKESYERKR